MGSKLTLLAAQLIALVAIVGRDAAADNASKARDLFKQGIEQYKAKQYDAAAATLAKSYELDPKPDALFAQAQSERLGGHCSEAVKHYRSLLETAKDLPTIKIVQTSLAACPKEPDVVPAKVEPTPEDHHEVVQAPPQIVTKTVVREVPRSDRLSTVLFAGGMLALGGGAGLYIASNGSLDDAKHARTLDDHDKFTDRAQLERNLSYGVAGAGALLITVAVIRWARGGAHESKPSTAEVAVAPASGGGVVTLSGAW
jgi:tetratricopeptide (TPR) repeat protein